MPLTRPEMLEQITAAGRRLGLELSPVELALVGSLYKTYRPDTTAWRTATHMAASIACSEAGVGESEIRTMAAIVDDLDAGFWCATLEHD
jgi:hypothetical protein